jgi:hypothetical protein
LIVRVEWSPLYYLHFRTLNRHSNLSPYMTMSTKEPRLAYFYQLKKLILKEIHGRGATTPASDSAAWSEGWTKNVTLKEYLLAIEKMIEALASLRDFEKEPLTEAEDSDLNEIWRLESALH